MSQEKSQPFNESYTTSFLNQIKKQTNLHYLNYFGEAELINRVIQDIKDMNPENMKFIDISFRTYRTNDSYQRMLDAIKLQAELDPAIEYTDFSKMYQAIRDKYKKSDTQEETQFVLLIIRDFDSFFENVDDLDSHFGNSFLESMNSFNNLSDNAILVLSKKNCSDRAYRRSNQKGSMNILSKDVQDLYAILTQPELENEIIRKLPRFKNTKDQVAKLASFLIEKGEFIYNRMLHYIKIIQSQKTTEFKKETLEEWDKDFIKTFPFKEYKEEMKIFQESLKVKKSVYKHWLEFKELFFGKSKPDTEEKRLEEKGVSTISRFHKTIKIGLGLFTAFPFLLFILYQLAIPFWGKDTVDKWMEDYKNFKNKTSEINNSTPKLPEKSPETNSKSEEAK